MAKYTMKFYGSVTGLKTGRTYHFDKNEVVDFMDGDDPKEAGEKIKKPRIAQN